jgi:outer membrane protein assembly factor BamA
MKTSKRRLTIMIGWAMLAAGISALAEENKPQGPRPENRSSFVILPIVFYSPETRWGGGTGGIFTYRPAWGRNGGHPSFIPFKAVYSQNKQCEVRIEPELYFKDDSLFLQANLSFEKFPERFYGIGNDVPAGEEEDYTPRHFSVCLSLQKRVFSGRNVFVGLAYEYDNYKFLELDPGGQLVVGAIPGSQGGTISGFSAILRWDTRDNVFFPRRGFNVMMKTNWNSGVFGSAYGYVKATADVKTYVPIFRSHVLALQGILQASSGDVPFMALPRLGGDKILRGIPSARFRDKFMTVFQAEYRMPVIWRFGLVGFAGIGSVGDRVAAWIDANWRFSAGWGIRFKLSPAEGINLRLDFGYGEGSSGIYITAAEAF